MDILRWINDGAENTSPCKSDQDGLGACLCPLVAFTWTIVDSSSILSDDHLCRLFGRGGPVCFHLLSFSLEFANSGVLTNSRARCRAGSSMWMARYLMGAVVPGARVLQS